MCNVLRFGPALVAGVLCAAPAAAQIYEGQPLDTSACRDLSGQVEIDGVMQPFTGRACQQPDGSWVLVNGYGQSWFLPGYAYDYEPYPGPYSYQPWYGWPPVLFGGSFVFFDGFHHRHHFDQDRFFGHHPNHIVDSPPGFRDHPGGGGAIPPSVPTHPSHIVMPRSVPAQPPQILMPGSVPAHPSHMVVPRSVPAQPPRAVALPGSVPAQPPHVVVPRNVPAQPPHVVVPRNVPAQPPHVVVPRNMPAQPPRMAAPPSGVRTQTGVGGVQPSGQGGNLHGH